MNSYIKRINSYCEINCLAACSPSYLLCLQVKEAESTIKHKLQPENAFFKAIDFDHLQACPREELHQFLIGLYGEYILPATFYRYTQILRAPELILSKPVQGNPIRHLVTDKMLAGVWTRLRDRLKALDSSTSMVEVTNEYAAHFYDMFINKHEGKHMTGDRIRILLLSMPFLLRDLISPEVCHPISMYDFIQLHMISWYDLTY